MADEVERDDLIRSIIEALEGAITADAVFHFNTAAQVADAMRDEFIITAREQETT